MQINLQQLFDNLQVHKKLKSLGWLNEHTAQAIGKHN